MDKLWSIHKERKKPRWILGGAWDNILWNNPGMPNKKSLDKYFKDVPVFLMNKECHGAWGNSKLFEMFNITKFTPDPPNGQYFRDENGEPTGYIHEAACSDIIKRIYAMITDEEIIEYIKPFIKMANKKGITSMGDVAGVTPIRENAYKIMEKNGQLNCRIRFYKEIEEGVESALERKKEYCSQILSFGGVKGFIDGTPQGYTGYMAEDYSDKTGERGKGLIEPSELNDMVKAYDKAGISVRIHACGDQGVCTCLDAMEYAKKENGGLHARHSVEHIEVILPEDIQRFSKICVIASVQPEHMPKYDFYGHPFHNILGEKRMNYAWPFGSILKYGGKLAFGTDCPVSDISPCRGIFRAVTRQTNEGQPKGGWNPKEKVTVQEALKAYTIGSAYAADMDGLIGTLEKNKLADFIVLEKNIIEKSEDIEEMFKMKTLLTVVDGEVVYDYNDKE